MWLRWKILQPTEFGWDSKHYEFYQTHIGKEFLPIEKGTFGFTDWTLKHWTELNFAVQGHYWVKNYVIDGNKIPSIFTSGHYRAELTMAYNDMIVFIVHAYYKLFGKYGY